MIINAGSLTTSHALTGSIFYAKKYPEKAAEVVEEINRVVGDRELEDLSMGELHDMEKLNFFLKETLRIGLPLSGAQLYHAKETTKIAGVVIPRATPIGFPASEKTFDSCSFGACSETQRSGRDRKSSSRSGLTLSRRCL